MSMRLFVTTLLLLGLAPAADALELQGKAKVYSDGEGSELVIAPVENDQALVRVTGTRSPWEGQVRLHTIDDLGNRGLDIWTNHNGYRYVTVVVRNSGWGGYNSYEFYVPGGNRDGKHVYFDEKKTAAFDPKALLAEYETQLKTRKPERPLLSAAQIERENHAAMLADLKGATMKEMLDKLAGAAGHPVAYEIDWGSFAKYDALQHVRYTATDRIADGIKQAGGEDAKRQAQIRAGVKRVVLRHADNPPAKPVTVQGGTLTIVGDYLGDKGYPSADDIAKVLEVVL